MKKLFLVLSIPLLTGFSGRALTLNVEVPDGTKKCFVCGSFNNWDASSAPMMNPEGKNLFSLELTDTEASKLAEGYKYLCGQDWLYVEKDASGGEVSNRTVPGNPDKVGSWRSMPEWTVETADVVINGYPRQLKIYLPEGYDEDETATYPIIYYNSVSQRFDNAGSDDDCGDYFFGAMSWNAPSTMEDLRAEGSPAYIMVQVPSYLAENTIAAHPDFAGTGAMEGYLKAFPESVMKYMEDNFRVRKGATNTVIVGADYGALFALYATAKRPDLFSRCVAMSPMLWINRPEFMQLASQAASNRYYISAGALEPQWMQEDAAEFTKILQKSSEGKAYFTLYPGETHNDASWSRSFPSVLKAISDDDQPVVAEIAPMMKAGNKAPDLGTAVYTLYAGPDAGNLEIIGKLQYTENYYKKGSDKAVKARTITYDIPASFKSKYYWNIACGEDSTSPWLYDTPNNIGFSSKKTETSWHNIAIFEDGSVQNNAAHSKAFRVVTSKETVMMTPTTGHTSSAVVKFPGEDKSFKVNFGSVNSASDMGALTSSLTVSDNCVEAEIFYDFELNKVTVNETQFCENLDKVKVLSFSADPASAIAGSDVRVTLHLNADCDLDLEATRNFNESIGAAFSKESEGVYTLTLPNVKEGIYNLKVNLSNGDNRLEDAANINVRVLPASSTSEKILTVNAYKDIDWNATGRYKANFHTHTSQSFDTQFTTTQVVDKYKAANYDILALTDHDANPYPWTMFDLWNPNAEKRNPEEMGMLAIPGCELSKDRRNNWSETTGGEFNHHTDLFTGRSGQEFLSLRESYAYTEALGGLQIINHPGQYWNLSTNYKNGEKNSPEWHAENFNLYKSLVGLEAYNQGNRRQNDRILWDQILTITMPRRPVWGFSCDDTHTAEQYFRNYQYMLMPELSTDALKDALRNGHTVFSYEYTGSGKALCPKINSINVDEESRTITIDADTDNIKWISSYHLTGTAPSTAQSTIVGYGKTFDYTGFQGSYVRALLTNKYGETATQPFGFSEDLSSVISIEDAERDNKLTVTNDGREITVKCTEPLERISVFNTAGIAVKFVQCNGNRQITFPASELEQGVHIIVAAATNAAYTDKLLVE